ncbi:hypothetical protein [Paenibacillus ihuae]|uniref:hypothetical protein n=1 Tax=Paenibacillus ihuae TaxID=1232431 RepID=UPI0006D56883|nr:hypothetical protein [Paenibacillus ihuae]
MDSKNDLSNQYVKSVNAKEQLLEKLNLTALSEEDLHKLLLLNCEMNELVGTMIEAGLIQIDVSQ